MTPQNILYYLIKEASCIVIAILDVRAKTLVSKNWLRFIQQSNPELHMLYVQCKNKTSSPFSFKLKIVFAGLIILFSFSISIIFNNII